MADQITVSSTANPYQAGLQCRIQQQEHDGCKQLYQAVSSTAFQSGYDKPYG